MNNFNCPKCFKPVMELTIKCPDCGFPVIVNFFENIASPLDKISSGLVIWFIFGGLLMVIGSTYLPYYYFKIENVEKLAGYLAVITFPGAIFLFLGISIAFGKFLLSKYRIIVKPKIMSKFLSNDI